PPPVRWCCGRWDGAPEPHGKHPIWKGEAAMSNLRHWLWLSTRSPAPGMYAARILEHFGTPERAYYADSAAYEAIPALPGSVRQALEDKDLTPAETILTKCRRLGIW